ncbi:MAG: HEPN domain-containing protein [Candidatus Riflebacteria bacterium]|nr:HEPN domain-containing protein [Candidatus Riflebacteria bacterium]
MDFKKHSAVISYFNKNYILTNIFDKTYGKVVNNAFEIRQKSDYEDFYVVDKTKTEDLLKNTEKFLADIDKYLQSKYK